MGARSSKNTTQNNRSDGHLLEYFRNTFIRGGGANAGPSAIPGIVGASGGTLVSPNPGGYELRHFPSGPATFSYTSAGGAETIHVLLVAGGGAGGFGGGGGGGIVYAYNLPVPANSASYTVTIGAGGASRANGGDSTFVGHPVGTITAKGGGGNIGPEGPNNNQRFGSPGGSGGGGGHGGASSPEYSGGTTTQPSQNPGYTWGGGALYQYGQPGGKGNTTGPTCCEGGGGGGAAGPTPLTAPLPVTFRETGTYNGPQNGLDIPGDGNGGGVGGNGITFGWIPSGLGASGYFGGGGPGSYCSPNSGGSQGGSGTGDCPPIGRASGNGTNGTGGGGGGGNATTTTGGNGIVLIYYQAR